MDDVYADLDRMGVDVVDVPMKANTAIAFLDDFIALDKRKCPTSAQERTVLMHEAGHFISGAFYRAYSPYELREQAENRAFAAAVAQYLPPEKLLAAMHAGYTESWQIAEFLDLDKAFVEDAVEYWKDCKNIEF